MTATSSPATTPSTIDEGQATTFSASFTDAGWNDTYTGAIDWGFGAPDAVTRLEVALAGLPGCVVAIEAQEPLGARLEALAQALGMRPIRLPAGARALYHGAGSFAAPFITAPSRDSSCQVP